MSGGFISQVREGEREREGGGGERCVEERGVRRLHITGEGGRESDREGGGGIRGVRRLHITGEGGRER